MDLVAITSESKFEERLSFQAGYLSLIKPSKGVHFNSDDAGSQYNPFKENTTANLKLVEAQPFSSGVVALIYEPDRK
ncbi:MAG TPA: hypothetical protein VH186_09115 [Chloroflexia bacterium]|nr:hypothetical protein [Chloroflexia bacterium]